MTPDHVPPDGCAITERDISTFFSTMLPNLKCPACGHEDFQVQFDENQDFSSVLNGTHSEGDPLFWGPVFAKFVTVLCLHCFHTLQFSSVHIVKWLAARKSEAADGKI